MKILVIADRKRYEKFMPKNDFTQSAEIVYFSRGTSDDEILESASDAQIIFVDAIMPVSEKLVLKMPQLKMIHSEGVAYNAIAIEAAAKRGIYVCNNKGCNAKAVAEQAVLLMLQVLRSSTEGDKAVRSGNQIKMKEYMMVRGITELGECKVGLVGFGDIAKATAKLLTAFGCEVYYYTPTKKTAEIEKEYGVSYLPLDELVSECDIVSIHCAVTSETEGMFDEKLISKMNQGAILVNTARGEIVDNIALRDALVEGRIYAGLDTISPEPVTADNPLLLLPEEAKYSLSVSPHLGGITTASFRRSHKHMWENALRIAKGEKPDNIVNGLK